MLNAWRQRGAGKYLEIFYLILIFIVPPVVSAIPFTKDGYGESGGWCWIRSTARNGDSFPPGIAMQYAIWYVPLYASILVGGSIYFIGIFVIRAKIRRHNRRYSSDGSVEQQTSLLKESNQFRLYPVVYFFINLVPLTNRIYEVVHKDQYCVGLWIASGIIGGLQGIIVAILFFTDSSTRRQILAKVNCPNNSQYDRTQTSGEATPITQSPQNSYDSTRR